MIVKITPYGVFIILVKCTSKDTKDDMTWESGAVISFILNQQQLVLLP